MSVFVVTRDQRLMQYDVPYGQSTWVRNVGTLWKIYYKTCACATCNDHAHEQGVAWVEKAAIVSIGFERPLCVEGRLLTESEKAKLTSLREWLERKKLPRRLDIQPLRVIAK